MNKTLSAVILLNFLFLPSVLKAENVDASENFWQCTSSDSENKKWMVNSGYELTAINKALEACKKQSNLPVSCKTVKGHCQVFLNGKSTRPMWRCMALDQMAKTWPSNIYSDRDEAALAAKASCHEGSSIPDTCYINLMTCRNLNSRE